MELIEKLVKNGRFQWFIVIVILVNAAVLGLLTQDLPPATLWFLSFVDDACLVIFCFEIGMKLLVFRLHFFRDGWNVFDFAVVIIAILPNTGALSILRALRVLRLLRLVTAVPAMRRVINGMFGALPGGASVAGVLFIMYYVASIIGVTLFSKDVPEFFGTIGTTFFTLFKLMTLEGWPDIAKVVMVNHPNAWIFFVAFIIFTTFTTLNLLFGIIVDAMEKAKEEEVREELAGQGIDIGGTSNEMRVATIEEDVKSIKAMLTELHAKAMAAGA